MEKQADEKTMRQKTTMGKKKPAMIQVLVGKTPQICQINEYRTKAHWKKRAVNLFEIPEEFAESGMEFIWQASIKDAGDFYSVVLTLKKKG